jgi:hypothetical protein
MSPAAVAMRTGSDSPACESPPPEDDEPEDEKRRVLRGGAAFAA